MAKMYIDVECDYNDCNKCRFCYDAGEEKCWCAVFDSFLKKTNIKAQRLECCQKWTAESEKTFRKNAAERVQHLLEKLGKTEPKDEDMVIVRG